MNELASLDPGTLLAGRFRIEKLLGSGAMGAVYAIRHELTRHERALKLLHPSARESPDIVRRFLNEASAAGRAGNPHLVETFDAGTLPSGEPYVVMELLSGETLTALLARAPEGRLDVVLAAELVSQAAAGAEAAHRAGIIHRDLKPDNLFVTTRDGRPFVKLLDFGVSKFATASGLSALETQAGMIYGSPAYMSPEQLAGKVDIDARTDVYGLGVVLFQCLTGQLPFDAANLYELSSRVFAGQSTPIESLRANLPPSLIAIVKRALAPLRDDRHASAAELAAALRELCSPGAAVVGAPSEPSLAHEPEADPNQTAASADSVLPEGRSLAPRWRSSRLIPIAALGLLALGAWLLLLRRGEPKPSASADVSSVAPSLPPPALESTAIAALAGPIASEATSATKTEPSPPVAAPLVRHVPTSERPEPSTPAAKARPADSIGLHSDNPFR